MTVSCGCFLDISAVLVGQTYSILKVLALIVLLKNAATYMGDTRNWMLYTPRIVTLLSRMKFKSSICGK